MSHRFSFSGVLALVAAALLPLAAAAAEPKKPLGDETKAWVDLQTSGQRASGAARPMPGEIADNVYQRYLDSFKQPIPAEFKRQSTDESGSGGGK